MHAREYRMLSVALVVLATFCGAGGVRVPQAAIEDQVQVLAGTDLSSGYSNGNTLPQVKRPWGFNDWVPQTTPDRFGSWFFRRSDESFFGIRCTHQPSPWIGDYGYFTVLPHLGSAEANAVQAYGGYDAVRRAAAASKMMSPPEYYTKYRPGQSTFHPYLFSTTLTEYLGNDVRDKYSRGTAGKPPQQIQFQLTPTSHAAAMQIEFPKNENGMVSIRLPRGRVSVDPTGLIVGNTTRATGGVSTAWMMHVVLKTHPPPARWKVIQEQHLVLEFDRKISSVDLRAATSFISASQAILNLDTETEGKDFAQLLEEARTEWRTALERVHIQPSSTKQGEIFYTNLWKSMLFPRFLHETDSAGQLVHFSPYTEKVHRGRLVADSGFWDAYHTVYPLLSVAHPSVLGQMIEGWVNSYQEAGWLPTWPSPGQRDCMVGTMGDVSLADAIVKSKMGFVSGFDVEKAWEAISKDAFVPPITPKNGRKNLGENLGRKDLDGYLQRGYVFEDLEPKRPIKTKQPKGYKFGRQPQEMILKPETSPLSGSDDMLVKSDSPMYPELSMVNSSGAPYPVEPKLVMQKDVGPYHSESVSMSMYNYIADAAVANAAAALGKVEEEKRLRRRSMQYQTLFNSTSGYFQPKRADGNFHNNFQPVAWRNGFTEGSAAQYRFNVPHDVEGLQSLFAGKLCKRIEEMLTFRGQYFEVGSYYQVIHEMLEGQGIQSEFGLYDHCNQPVHEVLWIAKKAGCNEIAEKYLRKVMDSLYTKDGWCGDEDNGEMGAWYVLASLGIYSLEGGKDELVLGSPNVRNAVIQLPAGNTLTISAENQRQSNVYVQEVTWKGKGAEPKMLGSTIKYSELMRGGELVFKMGPEPLRQDAAKPKSFLAGQPGQLRSM